MNRSDIIAKLAEQQPQLTVSDVATAVITLTEFIINHLAQGGRVEIRGFGSFSVHTRPPRLGRNPRTGEKVQVPEKLFPHFKPGTELRERVNVERVKQREKLVA